MIDRRRQRGRHDGGHRDWLKGCRSRGNGLHLPHGAARNRDKICEEVGGERAIGPLSAMSSCPSQAPGHAIEQPLDRRA